jgi:hypothetical protein
MSIEPTGRAVPGATARPQTSRLAPAATDAVNESSAVPASLTRQFDELLGLHTGPGNSTRGLSIAGRPRAPAPGSRGPASKPSRRESPAEHLARLKASLQAYYADDQACGPGRRPEETRALAEPAFRDAGEAMALLEGLKGPLRAKAIAERLPGFVYQMRVSAAYQLACALPQGEALVRAISAGAQGGLTDQLMQPLLLKGIEHADQKHAQASLFLPVLKAAVERYGTAKGIEEPGALPCMYQAVNGLAEALHGQAHAAELRMTFTMLHLGSLEGSTEEFEFALAPFRQFTQERLAQLQNIRDLHEDVRVPLRAEERSWLVAHLDALRGDAEAACLAGCRMAAQALGGEASAVADALLQFADSFRMMMMSLEQLRDLPRLPAEVAARMPGSTRDGVSTERPEVLAAQCEAAAQSGAGARARGVAAQAAPSVRTTSSSSRTRKGQRKQAPARALTCAATPAERPVVHELARDRLHRFPPPPAMPAGRLDLVALGNKLKRDSCVLQMYNDKTDPLVVGQAMRDAVRSWFGEPAAWQRMRGQVDAESSGTAADEVLLERIDQRLAGIGEFMDRIDAHELDRVKTHARPEESHVELLRSAGHISSVSPLRLLPSATDPDQTRGTVFEAAIQPAETSGGKSPAPIFLHLHTHAPVTTEACRRLPLSQLAAAHFKSEAQRGHGATWERLHDAMGQIHRGRLQTAALLKELQRRMA